MQRIVATGLLAIVMLVGCQSTQSTNPNSASSDYDGAWKGERFDLSGSSMCRPTEISGTITNGYMAIKLLYNNTSLTGWITQDGSIKLENDHAKWDYKFTGKAAGNRIDGKWSIGNAVCNGNWYIERG